MGEKVNSSALVVGIQESSSFPKLKRATAFCLPWQSFSIETLLPQGFSPFPVPKDIDFGQSFSFLFHFSYVLLELPNKY